MTYCCATDGGMGAFEPTVTREQVAAIRKQEQSEAARILELKTLSGLVSDVHARN